MSQSSLKRPTESRHSAGEKKLRSCFPISDSFDDYYCLACETELAEDISICINLDLPPCVYFSLALMITDSSQYNLLQHYQENNTIKTLSEYANRFAMEPDLADGTLGLLRVLLQDFETNGLLSIRSLMSKTSLHQERELKFISCCFSDMKMSIKDAILDQRSTVDWEAILMSDVRFARLLPLFAVLKDSSSRIALLSPIPSFTSLPEIFDDNDTIILSSNSYQEQEEELGLDSQLILSSSEETNARNFILPRLSSMANSQESIRAPDTQITVEFSEFNIPPSQLIQATNASQQTALDSNSIRDTDQDVLLPDIPDYEEFTDVELKSQLKRFGFKTSNSRKQMIKDLRTIHTSLHSSRSSTPAANDKTTSDLLMTPDIEQDIVLDLTSELPSSQEVNSQKSIDPVVKEDIIRHLKSQPNVWQKILTYSPVTIEECVLGTKFRKGDMKLVLDEAAAVYSHRKRSNEN